MTNEFGPMLYRKLKPFIAPMVIILIVVMIINLSVRFKTQRARAESQGVGINFTMINAPLSDSSEWRWRAELKATNHLNKTIPVQFGVYWCKNSSGVRGEDADINQSCAPNLSPDDFLETLIFEKKQLIVENRIDEINHPSVACGRVQIDIGWLNEILGGDVYDTGISCEQTPQTTTTPLPTQFQQPTISPQNQPQSSYQSNDQAVLDTLSCIFIGQCTGLLLDQNQTPEILDYSIQMRDTNIIPSTDKQRLITLSWPKAKIEYWDHIIQRSKDAGWNPAFVLTLWAEETGGSAKSKIEAGGAGDCTSCSNGHLGCAINEIQTIDRSLDCLFNNFSQFSNDQFPQFMQRYAGEKKIGEFIRNPYFPKGIKDWYFKLTSR